MKFMMNCPHHRDSRRATIEMAQEAGEENFFLFGLAADQVAASRRGTTLTGTTSTSPRRGGHRHDRMECIEPARTGDLARSAIPSAPRRPLHASCRSGRGAQGARAHSARFTRSPKPGRAGPCWNVAHSGKFSSDRTITQYASEIWGAKPCHVE